MKNVREEVGIDVSKNTLDVQLHCKKEHKVFGNNKKGFEALEKWILKQGLDPSEVIYCFENTGWYSIQLSLFLSAKKYFFVCENPIVIKRSIGLKREKSDKVYVVSDI